jgi:predicted TIM-barrel fold metal-dependent hydrolase
MYDMHVIDADSHIVEPRTTWADHIDPAHRGDALAIEDDELGYPWLTWRGERIYLAEVQAPGEPLAIGEQRLRMEQGLPAEHRYDDVLPAAHSEPAARVAMLDEWGVDSTVLFPNYGLLWEELLGADVPAMCANMSAYNRWAGSVVTDGKGRLHGVAHVSLRDPDWAIAELGRLAAAGIKLAMVAPATVNGKALAHPSLDRVWQAFVEHDIAVVFHVGGFRQPFEKAWYEGDSEPVDLLVSSVFLHVAPALAITNLILMGALERHPLLRIGVIELTAGWVPAFLMQLDGAAGFYKARHGRLPVDLPLSPSDYFRRQVRVGALSYEQPSRLVRLVGEDTFVFGSDWPHAEGIAHPLRDYERALADLTEPARDKLLGGNAEWLLGVS